MAAILLILVGAEDAGWVNILVMVPMLLLMGEVTPKTIAVSDPVRFSTGISVRILPGWIYFVTPLRASRGPARGRSDHEPAGGRSDGSG